MHPDGAVGIDIERVSGRSDGVETIALADTERALLAGLAGADLDLRALWFTRFWTAKEAVAKADGTGLAGQPKRFVVEAVTNGYLRVGVVDPEPHVRWVAHDLINAVGERQDDHTSPEHTSPDHTRPGHGMADRYVVAWTSPEVEKAVRENEGVRT